MTTSPKLKSCHEGIMDNDPPRGQLAKHGSLKLEYVGPLTAFNLKSLQNFNLNQYRCSIFIFFLRFAINNVD